MFSILIPTWNNLAYLKLCIESIRKYSRHDHEILIHVNEGSDGTLEWVRAQGLKHSHSRENIGICLAVNCLAGQATNDWLVYVNDDMVCCPGWDTAFSKAIESGGTDLALYFSTMIEPTDTGNQAVIVRDFGRTPEDFNESRMLEQYMSDARGDRAGRASQPTLVNRLWWHMVGGYSIEFGPGMSSDDDLLMKFWVAGCRNFRIIGSSRFYHFGCRSTARVRRNRGGRTFLMKWGITQQEFSARYLTQSAETGKSPADADSAARDLPQATLLGKIKRLGYGLLNYPLGDLRAWDPAPGRHFARSDWHHFSEERGGSDDGASD